MTLLQGARLTAFELLSSGVDVTLICDNMSATVMKNGWVDAIFVGCDCRNYGSTDFICSISVCCHTVTTHKNCIYPTVFHNSCRHIITDQIKIEQRKPEEVTEMWYKERMAPEGVKVFNPAFDVTDHELIAGIVTEFGIARPPYTESFKEIFAKKEAAQKNK